MQKLRFNYYNLATKYSKHQTVSHGTLAGSNTFNSILIWWKPSRAKDERFMIDFTRLLYSSIK
jgi:hypothetical protein